MIKRLLVANRGEIACRIIDTCKNMGIETVAIYSVVDKKQRHVALADFSVCIGDNHPESSYLNAANIIQAAISQKCEAIHPGYGFLSEDATFAHQVESSGLIFVGPTSNVMANLSNKLHVKRSVEALNIPIINGSKEIISSLEQAEEIVSVIHYPCMLKSSNGEGGRHIFIIQNHEDLVNRFNSLKSTSLDNKHSTIYIESYLNPVKHIEVQLLVDHYHNVVSLGLRDCSIQNNHTKLIEESAHSLNSSLQQKLIEQSCIIAQKLEINNICTIEYLVDSTMNYYFMEINPRIQVEHPITEAVTNIDIIQAQLEIAQKLPLKMTQNDITHHGHSIECRLYSHDLKRSFIDFFYIPKSNNIRVDSAIKNQGLIPVFYDGLIAKIIAHGKDRNDAINHLIAALHQSIVIGIDTNLDLLKSVIMNNDFKDGSYSTQTVSGILSIDKSENVENNDSSLYQCEKCQSTSPYDTFEDNSYVCPICNHHPIVSAKKIASLLLEKDSIIEIDATLTTNHNHQTQSYKQKILDAQEVSSSQEAILCFVGKIGSINVCLGIFEASFMMGSLGSVVGEKICRLADYAKDKQFPLIIVSASGGARMQEGVEALMQMAKTSMAIDNFKQEGLFISVCTHPTMGGTTASFAMQGDIIIAHPQAKIGFSGKRVVEQTLHQHFDDSIQKAEVLISNGWIDKIVSRNQLKDTLLQLLTLHKIKDFETMKTKGLTFISNHETSVWEEVLKARELNRIKANDLINECFDSFVSLHDEIHYNNPALITGVGLFQGLPVTVIAQNKGIDHAKSNNHQSGMMKPDEYRKIVRVVRQAEKFKRPIITIIDTPGADPRMESEVSGQASAISDALSVFSNAKVPIISIILSEGGSGGALAIGISDVTLMFENAYYSIISPEGYASILYNDSKKASLATNHMKITASQLKEMQIIDAIISEKSHHDMISQCINTISIYLEGLIKLDAHTLINNRYQKYRSIAPVIT